MQNNIGKTALLEALYLYHAPTINTIEALRGVRKEEAGFRVVFPERAWDNFFFNQERQRLIGLVAENETGSHERAELSCAVEKFQQATKGDTPENSANLETLLAGGELWQSTLHLHWQVNGEKQPVFTVTAQPNNHQLNENGYMPSTPKVRFIPSTFRPSGSTLAQEYDKADFLNKADRVLRTLQEIDPSISQMKALTIKTPNLYLRREQENLLPISLFGEATRRASDFILTLMNNEYGLLLIDEVENGFHHIVQRNLWRILFRLAVECKAQLFATTHSLEMIQAFSEVWAEEGHQDNGAYIELARHVRTGRLVGITHELELLNYELQHGGKEIRGE